MEEGKEGGREGGSVGMNQHSTHFVTILPSLQDLINICYEK